MIMINYESTRIMIMNKEKKKKIVEQSSQINGNEIGEKSTFSCAILNYTG